MTLVWMHPGDWFSWYELQFLSSDPSIEITHPELFDNLQLDAVNTDSERKNCRFCSWMVKDHHIINAGAEAKKMGGLSQPIDNDL